MQSWIAGAFDWLVRGCTAVVIVIIVILMVEAASLDWGLYSNIGTIRLQHGYSITMEEDMDMGEVYGRLRFPGGLAAPGVDVHGFRLAWLEHSNKAPHFIVNQTTDGNVAWVAAEKHPDQVLFLIDYRNGDYWSYDNTWRMSDDTA